MGAAPGPESHYAVCSGQAAAETHDPFARPLYEHYPARAEPLTVSSIKQPQLDLRSWLRNLGTYWMKAPGRDPLWWPMRKEQAVASLMAPSQQVQACLAGDGVSRPE